MFKFGIKADHFVASALFLKNNLLVAELIKLLKFTQKFPIESDSARYQLALCNHFVDKHPTALEIIGKLDPKTSSPKVALLWLDILLGCHQFEAFDTLYIALIAKTPNNPELQTRKTNALYVLGQYDACQQLLDETTRTSTTTATLDRLQARIHFFQDRHDQAASISLAFLNDQKSDLDHYYLHYYILLCTGHIEQAMALLRRLPTPSYPTSLRNKKSVYEIGPLKGKTIYVVPEQGIGDRVELSRFYKRAAEMGINLKTRQPKNLVRLLTNMTAAPVHLRKKPKATDFDASIGMASLPALLNITTKEDMRSQPYLTAEPKYADRWKACIDKQKPLIGLAWKGSDLGWLDYNRSIPLKALTPILMRTDINVVCLQIGAALNEIDELPTGHQLTVFPDLDKGKDAYIDTVGLISNLDLVVTPDTSMAHVAGAMGAPSLVLLGKYPDLRWLQDVRPDYLYQNQDIIRQDIFADWETSVQKLNDYIDAKFQLCR